jgi:hypothetical protein
MKSLWILQTNKQLYLDECHKYSVYGVESYKYRSLEAMQHGDMILLRLRLRGNGAHFGYVGPYQATTRIGKWAVQTDNNVGIWNKISDVLSQGPSWIEHFPWCVFLSPTKDFVRDMRTLSISGNLPACSPIHDPLAHNILSNLKLPTQSTTYTSKKFRTKRGVLVRSKAEYLIDNWFTDHNIVTLYEYPLYLDSVKLTPDWYIPEIETYVEYLGLKGNINYDTAWNRKNAMYKKHGLNIVTLDDSDIRNLYNAIPLKIPKLRNLCKA